MTRTRNRALALIVLLLLGAAGAALRPAGEAERAGWRADLADLEAHVSRAYANLEWEVRHGRVDPGALHDSTAAALARARTGRDARRALTAFAAAFHDGHFYLARPAPAVVIAVMRLWDRRGTPPAAAWSGARACRALGYSPDDREFGLPFDRLEGFRPVDGPADVPGGLVTLPNGARAGLVRISLFSSYAHGSACADVWNRIRDTLALRCDDRCSAALDSLVDDNVLARLSERVRSLATAGASVLLVDLTGNGGGEDIVDPMARILTPVPLRAAAKPVLRHAHATTQLEQLRDGLAPDLARTNLPAAERAMVETAALRLDSLIARTRRPCDWSAIWRGGAAAASCSMLVRGGLFSTGLLDYAAPGSLDGLQSKQVLFGPSRYAFEEGVWRGPVVVLVDRRTASAAEGFAAILRDNGAAVVIGERTYGAGCGYTDGGIRHVLPHTGLDVRLPDCVRARADGMNEVEGVTPDVPIAWDGAGDLERARLVAAALGRGISPPGR